MNLLVKWLAPESLSDGEKSDVVYKNHIHYTDMLISIIVMYTHSVHLV